MGATTAPKYRKPVRFSALPVSDRTAIENKLLVDLLIDKPKWANLSEAVEWGTVRRRLDALARKLGGKKSISAHRILWENYAAPYLTEAEYDTIFDQQDGKCHLILAEVKKKIQAKFPAVPATNIDLITSVFPGMTRNSEFELFHLIALNEFIAHRCGDGTTFGQFLAEPGTAADINDKMYTLAPTIATHTNKLFSSAASYTPNCGLALWYRGVPSTKNHLMSFTADNYVTLLTGEVYSRLVVRNGQMPKLLQSLTEKLNYEEENSGPVTKFALEELLVKAVMGARNEHGRINAKQPAESLAAALSAMTWVIHSSNALNPSGNSVAHRFDSRPIRDTLTFLAEHRNELSRDEMIAVVAALAEINGFVRSTDPVDSFKVFVDVMRRGSVEQTINFCRLIGHILLTREGVRPTSPQWANHLKTFDILDLDPILSVGFLVEATEPAKGRIPNTNLAHWRARFNA